jgi:hypothetical protein
VSGLGRTWMDIRLQQPENTNGYPCMRRDGIPMKVALTWSEIFGKTRM